MCPNPACGVRTVLSTSWWLSKKKGDLAWVEANLADGQVALTVKSGQREGAPLPESPRLGVVRSLHATDVAQLSLRPT